jgi:hypothetical protein
MAIFYTDSGSFNDLKVTGSAIISASRGVALQLRSSGSTIFSVSGSGGEIFNISDAGSSTALFTVASSSVNVLNVDITKNVSVSGSLVVTGSTIFRGNQTITGSVNITGSVFIPSLVTSSTAVTNVVMQGTNGQLFTTASSAIGGGGGAVSSVSGTGGGINVDPTTGNVVVSNTGVHSISVDEGYPLSVTPTTGAAVVKTTYTQLSQIFNQNSSNQVSVLSTPINSTGDTFNWSYRGSAGHYRLSANGTPFTANKTMIQLCLGSNGRALYATHEYVSTSQIDIYIFDETGNGADDLLLYANIDIKIFP